MTVTDRELSLTTMSEVPPQTVEEQVRFLARTAIEGEPQDLCDSILTLASKEMVDSPDTFTRLTHRVLSTKIANQLLVSPKRVEGALTAYYTVFPGGSGSQTESLTKRARREEHLTHNIAVAYAHQKDRPEIRLLTKLEADFRHRAGDQVGDAALELLAAYGWALRSDYATTRIALFRAVGMSQMLSNRRG